MIKTKFLSLFNLEFLKAVLVKFDPRLMLKNPVMFLVELSLVICTIYLFLVFRTDENWGFHLAIAILIFLTICFSNIAEAIAEKNGKKQLELIKKNNPTFQVTLLKDGQKKTADAFDLKTGDIVLCQTGDIIPADGEIIEGIATIDESAITGESAPVIKESDSSRDLVIAGTKVISDQISIKVLDSTKERNINAGSFLLSADTRVKSENEKMLSAFLMIQSFIYIILIFCLKAYDIIIYNITGQPASPILTIPVYLSIFISLLPTTIAGLLSCIGISAIDRLLRKNVIVQNVHALEAAGDIDVVIFDKTGTITNGNRKAHRYYPIEGVDPQEFARLAQLSSYNDDTIEGISIRSLSKTNYGIKPNPDTLQNCRYYPFSSFTKMSGVDYVFKGEKFAVRKGAVDAIETYLNKMGSTISNDIYEQADKLTKQGDTPLVLTYDNKAIGLIQLKDNVKGNLKRHFTYLRNMGIKTVMVTGDNELTAATIAAEAGIEDFVANATPDLKLVLIKQYQEQGKVVTMVGDGTNDAPALAQANIGLSMKSGTSTAQETSNMIDLDNNPTKVLDILKFGRQILSTRGNLTTFSLASDLAKFLVLLPSLYTGVYKLNQETGPLEMLNFLNIGSIKTAVLSTLIVNASLIVVLIPLATTGIKNSINSATKLLWKNLLIYGLGGMLATLIFIKVVDIILQYLGIV